MHVCHFLIGVPGSGKSTFATELAKLGNYCIVSTDEIRQKLYGDPAIQGVWSEIETEAINQICIALKSDQGVIYDATNFKRPWRMDFLQKCRDAIWKKCRDAIWKKCRDAKYKKCRDAKYKKCRDAKFRVSTGDSDGDRVSTNDSGRDRVSTNDSGCDCVSTNDFGVTWIAWYLKTPLNTCIRWNQERSRQVPQAVIESMYKSLQKFPPIAAEGFATVEKIDVTSEKFNIQQVSSKINNLHRCIINRSNRHRHLEFHRYSNFLDFDRLMHLISLIIRYPGLGNLQTTNPQQLSEILGDIPQFESDRDEITAIVGKLYGDIYADKTAITADLKWLQNQGLINAGNREQGTGNRDDLKSLHNQGLINTGNGEQGTGNRDDLECLQNKDREQGTAVRPRDDASRHPAQPPRRVGMLTKTGNGENSLNPVAVEPSKTHRYSDRQIFERLIAIIDYILHHPFSDITNLVSALAKQGFIIGNDRNNIRKDIEEVLKPYQILPNFPMRNGYFAGTGILSNQELVRIFALIQSQAQSLADPLALEIYEIFNQRMLGAKLINSDGVYPVRGIANHSMVNSQDLPPDTLVKNISKLENAIANGELLELNRRKHSARYDGDECNFFLAYPLQIVFHNFAWYLGYECVDGEEPGLLRFERLDRLFLGRLQSSRRTRQDQEKSLRRLQTLLTASAGLFLGYSAKNQEQFLSQNKKQRSQVCVTVELWFSDRAYQFIVEGTKRFAQIKMSPPAGYGQGNLPGSIFCLQQTTDKNFPNRFQTTLPKWSLHDFDLWRWIVGFSKNVKVIEPPELVEKVKDIGEGIVGVYEK